MSEREGQSERGSSYRCMHKRGFDWANIITWNEIKTVNESLFHSVSPSILSPLFFIMRIPNLFHFIIVPAPTHTHPKCHMYENHTSIRQLICHDICVAAIYIQCINLITGGKGGIFTVSLHCHYHWQQSTRRKGFVIRYAFIKEMYYDYMAYCSKTAGVSCHCGLHFAPGRPTERWGKEEWRRQTFRLIKVTALCYVYIRKVVFGTQ